MSQSYLRAFCKINYALTHTVPASNAADLYFYLSSCIRWKNDNMLESTNEFFEHIHVNVYRSQCLLTYVSADVDKLQGT